MVLFTRNALAATLSGLLVLGASSQAASAPSRSGTDQLIVRFDADVIGGRAEANRLSTALGKTLNFVRKTASGRVIFQVASDEADKDHSLRAMRGLAKAIQRLPGVVYAEPDILLTAFAEPNDPLFPTYQWHYYGPGDNEAGGVNAVAAWNLLGSGSDTPITVAVLDTGITDHADLNANVIAGRDMISFTSLSNDGDGRDDDPSDPGDYTATESSSWHGTHVAGTIGAVTNNAVGVAGVGYDRVKIMPVRVLGTGGGALSDVADGIVWAADNGARVINMSLGAAELCTANSVMQQAINYAVSLDVSVVVAAGNNNADSTAYTPAGCANVISVAAVNRAGGKASYSNFGSKVDLAAPGGDSSNPASIGTYIVSTHNAGTTSPGAAGYAGMAGTSMAAPHVAGVAALLYAENSSLTPAEVEAILIDSARPFAQTCNGCGSGIADAARALNVSSPTTPEEPVLEAPASPFLSTTLESGSGPLTLSWLSVDGATGYELEVSVLKRKGFSSYTSLGPVTSSGDIYSYSYTPAAGTYLYRVRASNSAGSSAWTESNEITIQSSTTDSGSGSGKCNPKRGC